MSTSVAFLLMTGAVPLGSIWMGSAPHWSPPGLVGMPASQMSHSWRSPHSISACRAWRAPARLVLDAFGCRLTTTILPGDGRRTQHDTLKRWAHQGLKEMQMRIRSEVCLFAATSSLAARRRLDGETLRKRQGLVPDFLVHASWGWPEQPTLMMLKTFHHGSSTYAVDAGRSHALPGECANKARRLDRQLCSIPPGEVGPVERQLQSFGGLWGLVFGAWGKASPDVELLPRLAVAIGAEHHWRSMGCIEPSLARSALAWLLR